MRAYPFEKKDEHVLELTGKREAFRVSRAIGLWRYSGVKLIVAAFTGDTDLRIDTVNLETIERNLKPPSPELKEYLGSIAIAQNTEVIEQLVPTIITV